MFTEIKRNKIKSWVVSPKSEMTQFVIRSSCVFELTLLVLPNRGKYHDMKGKAREREK